MKILICSDGTAEAQNASRIGGLLGVPCQAECTLLGIAEAAQDEVPLRAALEKEAAALRVGGLKPALKILSGDPIRQILEHTAQEKYDLAIISARHKGASGLYWRSERTYEVIKAIQPPVLVAMGQCETLKRFLVCTGGKQFIEDAVKLTGQVAACVGASVTLLHVMAEPPAVYADLVRMEEDVEHLLASDSELGRNLRGQKESFEKIGVKAEVRVRHGLVLEQVFAEQRDGGHDLIVTGSSQSRGPFRHYIMGDLTRSIVNRADCPVLVARATGAAVSSAASGGFLQRFFRGIFQAK
jgi:nucleotide-binding universal stress UspA family protein